MLQQSLNEDRHFNGLEWVGVQPSVIQQPDCRPESPFVEATTWLGRRSTFGWTEMRQTSAERDATAPLSSRIPFVEATPWLGRRSACG